MAYVSKKGNMWRASWRFQGKLIARSTGLKHADYTRPEALDVAREMERAHRVAHRGDLTHAAARKVVERIAESTGEVSAFAMTWQEAANDWAARKQRTTSLRTAENYRPKLASFSEYLDAEGPGRDVRLDRIAAREIEVFPHWLQKARKQAPSSAWHALSIIRMVFREAHLDGLIPSNPAARVRKPRGVTADETPERALTDAELEALLEAAEVYDPEWVTAILIGRWTGARLSDAVRMEGGNFRVAENPPWYEYRQAKTRALVRAPLMPDLLAHVRPLADGGPLTPGLASRDTGGARGLSDQFATIVKAAGIERVNLRPDAGRPRYDVGFHSLRHTFIAWMKRKGVPRAVRMEIVGHASGEHDRYGALSVEDMGRALGQSGN